MHRPILFSLYAMIVVTTVGNNIFLGFWSAQSINGFQQGDYMAIYAAVSEVVYWVEGLD